MNKLSWITIIVVSFITGCVLGYFFDLGKISFGSKSLKRFYLKNTLDFIDTHEIIIENIKDEDQKHYVRRLLKVTWRELQTEAYLLIPKGNSVKYPAILAVHGHHTTKEDVIGIGNSKKANVDFGVRLVEAGYLVLAPDIPFARNLGLEDHIALNFIMTGTSLMGYRISYLNALVDYMCSLPYIDSIRIGCIGWSMGGGLAMYLAAIDTRLKVVAISNYFGTYRDTFMRIRQSTDNYIPGILNFGEMADVACLIEPRPMWIESSSQDPEFPVRAFKEELERLTCCYGEKKENLTYHIIKGGHRFQGEDIVEWFTKHL